MAQDGQLVFGGRIGSRQISLDQQREAGVLLHLVGRDARVQCQEVHPARALLEAGPHAVVNLKAGEASWQIVTVPVPGGPLTTAHDRAWLVLAAGLLITGVVVLYLASSVRHARRLLLANRQISKLAHKDPLTGLLNRRAFNEHLAAAAKTPSLTPADVPDDEVWAGVPARVLTKQSVAKSSARCIT